MTDGKPTLTIGIVPLLTSLDLKDELDLTLINAIDNSGLGRTDAGQEFAFKKLDELTEFVSNNQPPDGTTTAELKLLIHDWLNEHLVGGQNDR